MRKTLTIIQTWFVILFASAAMPAAEPTTRPLAELPEQITAAVHIDAGRVVREVSPVLLGTNLTQYATDKAQIKRPEVLERVRRMGQKTIRFPNGCFADLYNWQKPAPNEVTVDEFLDFCDAIDAEPYYTLNMQGGTEGREGPPPAGAPLEEVIKYRHTAPNPCGNTNYYFGTLPEALALFQKYTIERALAGKRPILHYELGNENWGQSRTDWTPPIYGKNAEVWARALREALQQAQKQHPQLGELKLHITAVGYPTMGNNQDPLKAPDREINLAWTAEMNRLADLKLIDAVQEHFYPFPPNNGDAVIWTVHNLHNILALRCGVPSERLGGYFDEKLAYKLPLEVTEWNLKCWGRNALQPLPGLRNGGFEDNPEGHAPATQPAGWEVVVAGDASRAAGQAAADERTGVVTTAKAARHGRSGARLTTAASGGSVTLQQTFSVADHLSKAVSFGAYLWVKTSQPHNLKISLAQTNEGPNAGKVLMERTATQVNMWERILISHKPMEDTREMRLSVTLSGASAWAMVDDVRPVFWPSFSDMMPPAATRFEQQLFAVDAFREMLRWPVLRTHWHHLFGNYSCPQLKADGSERDNSSIYFFLTGRIGRELLSTTCEVPTFDYDSHADAWASDFNAVTPDVRDIPALSAVATRQGDDIFLLLVNRTTDRNIQVALSVSGTELHEVADLRTLHGTLDLPGAEVKAGELRLKSPPTHTVPPFTAQILRLRQK